MQMMIAAATPGLTARLSAAAREAGYAPLWSDTVDPARLLASSLGVGFGDALAVDARLGCGPALALLQMAAEVEPRLGLIALADEETLRGGVFAALTPPAALLLPREAERQTLTLAMATYAGGASYLGAGGPDPATAALPRRNADLASGHVALDRPS